MNEVCEDTQLEQLLLSEGYNTPTKFSRCKSLLLFLKKDFRNGFLRSFIELHNHYKILILEPIKDKFNHTKRRIHKGVFTLYYLMFLFLMRT